MPTSVFRSVDLPAPLRPSSATISCSRTSKRHIVEDVALAVERVDPVERQQRLGARPRSARRPASAWAARADVDLLHALARSGRPRPCRRPARWPSFITVTASARRNTRSMSCSTSSTGMSTEMLLDQAHRRARARRRRARRAARRAAGCAAWWRVPAPCRAAAGRHRTAMPASALLDAGQPHGTRSGSPVSL